MNDLLKQLLDLATAFAGESSLCLFSKTGASMLEGLVGGGRLEGAGGSYVSRVPRFPKGRHGKLPLSP